MRALSCLFCGVIALATIFACSKEDARTASPAAKDPSGPDGSSGTSSGQVIASPTMDGSSPPQSPVDVTRETLSFGGRSRRYVLAKPKTYDASRSYPLVLSFHGNPGSADNQAASLPFETVSGSEAVIVYPEAAYGDDSGWFHWDIYSPNAENADMGFVQALIAEVKANKANIDETRVVGFGYSGGGFFLAHHACRFGGVFKAISISAGGGPDEEAMGYAKKPNGCYVCPGGPTATLVTHGADDPEVVAASGEFTATCYADTNGCGDSYGPTTPAPCQLHAACPAATPVKRCIIPGLGHGPWGDAMKETWAFFSALP